MPTPGWQTGVWLQMACQGHMHSPSLPVEVLLPPWDWVGLEWGGVGLGWDWGWCISDSDGDMTRNKLQGSKRAT